MLVALKEGGNWTCPPPRDMWQGLDTFLFVTTGRKGSYWRPVGRGQGCCGNSYKAQDCPRDSEMSAESREESLLALSVYFNVFLLFLQNWAYTFVTRTFCLTLNHRLSPHHEVSQCVFGNRVFLLNSCTLTTPSHWDSMRCRSVCLTKSPHQALKKFSAMKLGDN